MSEINTNKTEVKETTEPKETPEAQMDDSLSKDLDHAHKSKLDGNASTVEPTAEQQEGGDGSEQQKQPEDDDESGTGKKTETPPDAEQPTTENEQAEGGKFSRVFLKTLAIFTLPFSGGPSTPDVQFPTVEVANSHHEAMDTQEESSSVLKFEGEDGTEYVCTYEIGKPYFEESDKKDDEVE